jgi:hypothetical protein
LLVSLVIFFALEFLYPRFSEIDESFFKSAGRNLSAGHSFAAPEMENFSYLSHLVPPVQHIFFAHPPVYSWLFGQAVRLLGFGWKVCVTYDALISAALSVGVFGLTRRLFKMISGPESGPPRAALLLLPALFTLMLRQPARPDELAMTFSYANLWLLSMGPFGVGTALASGFLAGLTLCTSTGVWIGFLPLIGAFWLLHANRVRLPLLLTLSIAGAMGAAAICLVPLYLMEPTFYHQFFQHARVVLDSSTLIRISEAVQLAWRVATPRLLVIVVTLPLLCLGLVRAWSIRPRIETFAIYVAPIVGFLLLFYLRSGHTYWWFLQPWFLTVALLVAARSWGEERKWSSLAATAWLVLGLSGSLMWPVKVYVARVSLPSNQQIAFCEERLRQVIPVNATVLTLNAWWTLARDRTVLHPNASDIDDLRRIDYFVGDGNGTGTPGTWSEPANPRYKALLRNEFEVIRDDLPRDRVQILGRAVSASAYGFGSIVLRRIPRVEEARAPGN